MWRNCYSRLQRRRRESGAVQQTSTAREKTGQRTKRARSERVAAADYFTGTRGALYYMTGKRCTLNYNTGSERLRRLTFSRPSVRNRVDYKIFRPSCSPGTKCLSFCSGAWNLRATWGDGAAAAVKPLSPPGGEQLVVAGVLKCAA